MERCDVLIVGAGPGGLAAAKAAKDSGAGRVLVLERDFISGGILNQCIHDGFGLIRYGRQLTGPEYAHMIFSEAIAAGAVIETDNQVISISEDKVVTSICRDGLRSIKAGAIVLATGCRERTRGAISIPGSRPAGVYTAGVVQNLVNMRNIMVGKNVVVLGSGDIGLIMARRLSIEGALVKAVVEIMPAPCGLARNVSQCLYDYDIPLFVNHTVSNIIGKKKLEAVEISELDPNGRVLRESSRVLSCDCLVLSVGLIPENEVAKTAGIKLDEKSNGALTDEFLQTNVQGIFSCGNSRRIMDLADFVSEQAYAAGENAVRYIKGSPLKAWDGEAAASMLKGFPVSGSVTCPLCPNGCQVSFNSDINDYEGNQCARGAEFAREEEENPKRILTTTMRLDGGSRALVSVKTESPVEKSLLLPFRNKLSAITVKAPVHIGQVLYSDENATVVATETVL